MGTANTDKDRQGSRASSETSEGALHKGHRQRIRARFLRSGADDFEPHELLELILFYAIPQGDVNALAHRLIRRFGSLAGVLEATEDELKSVDGVGDHTACLIRLFPAVMRAYARQKNAPAEVYDSLGKLITYLRPLYVGLTVERVYLVLLDNGMRMLDCIPVADGTVNCTNVTVRQIAELCLSKHAACAVLAHNHPNGMAIPSGADIEMTNRIEGALDVVGVPLLEHIILADHSEIPILHNRKGVLRAAPGTGKIDRAFYDNFYRDMDAERRWDDFLL